MRIAFYSDSYSPYVSGVVRSLERFTKGLVTQGHEVYIFAPFYYGKKFTKPIAQQSDPYATKVFRFRSVPAPTCPGFYLPIPVTVHSEKLLRQLNIDVIHTHSPFLTGQLGAILAKRLHIPLFFTHHTMYHEYTHYVPAPPRATRSITLNFLKWYCSQCTHIITPSDVTKGIIQNLYQVATPVTTIPTGIDLEPYTSANRAWLKAKLKLTPETPVILSLGRISKEKNPHLLIKAFRLIQQKLPQAHLAFAGSGSELNNLKKLARNLGLGQNIHFMGSLNVNEVVAAYMGADLFMFASQTETQGLVTLEAMAAGLPVVAVNASGTNEVVISGQTGVLTTPHAEEMAQHAINILTNENLYESYKVGALAQATKFSINATATQLVNLYQNAK